MFVACNMSGACHRRHIVPRSLYVDDIRIAVESWDAVVRSVCNVINQKISGQGIDAEHTDRQPLSRGERKCVVCGELIQVLRP